MIGMNRSYDAAFLLPGTPHTSTQAIPAQRHTDGAASLRLLLVEDNAADVALARAHLLAVRPIVVLDHVTRLADVTVDRAQSADCALLDLSLPDASGLQVVTAVRALSDRLPIVVLTGYDDSAIGVAALRAGAQDYLVKSHADGFTLDRAIRYASERLRLERQLTYQALHDPLTGLPNRALFRDRVLHAIKRAQRTGAIFAVMLADLDGFKSVNDSLGHTEGDALLVEVTRRLSGATRPGDTLARLGGDEFAMLCEELHSREEATAIARRLADTFLDPIVVAGHRSHVGVSIGITAAAGDTADPGVLIRDADIALYEAKNSGRGRACWFTTDLHDRALERLSLEGSLREAIRDGGGLSVVYQPIVDLRTDAPLMIEALVRWREPGRGAVEPATFLPIAEQSSLIVELDCFVLAHAVEELAARRRQRPGLRVSVNVSGRTLASVGFVDRVARQLAHAGLTADALTIEIVDTALRNPTALVAAQELRHAGVRIALEDFGAGPSSLHQMLTLTVDALKLDSWFVTAGAAGDRRAIAALRAIVSVGRELGMELIAKDVADDVQLAFVRELGVHVAQGYRWGRP